MQGPCVKSTITRGARCSRAGALPTCDAHASTAMHAVLGQMEAAHKLMFSQERIVKDITNIYTNKKYTAP